MHLPPFPSAILFDWDNTLADSMPIIHAALTVAFKAVNLEPWSYEKVATGIHRSARESFPEIFGERWEEAHTVYYDAFEKLHKEKVQPMQGALPVLQAAQQQNIPLAVVSNKRTAYLKAEITMLGWQDFFHTIIGAGDAARDKPDSAPALLALEKLGKKNISQQEKNKIWFVGDSITDMECAHKCDFYAILVRDKIAANDEFTTYPPKLYVKNCAELTEILNKQRYFT